MAEMVALRAVDRAVHTTPQTANADKLASDVLRWYAAKLDPARWSDKAELQVTVTNPEADADKARQRAELVAALQRLAKPLPLTIEGDAEPPDITKP
jgi:hypothetical protein